MLVFCASRLETERSCSEIAARVLQHKAPLAPHVQQQRANVVAQLAKTPSGLDSVLAKTVPAGVAYHHAGLTVDERQIIEAAFRSGAINVLTATSTLAAGVNLPARRVIFRTPKIGTAMLDPIRYQQMAGRAGRTGIDTQGESIVIATAHDVPLVRSLLSHQLTALDSCLRAGKRGCARSLLEVMVGGVVETLADVVNFTRRTLLYIAAHDAAGASASSCSSSSSGPSNSAEDPMALSASWTKSKLGDTVDRSIQEALTMLVTHNFIEWHNDGKVFRPTHLGRATVASGLDPEEGLVRSVRAVEPCS